MTDPRRPYEAPTVAKIMPMAEAAKLAGVRTETMRRWLQKRGIAFQIVPGRGNGWYCTLAGIRAKLPEIFTTIQGEAVRRHFDLSEYE